MCHGSASKPAAEQARRPPAVERLRHEPHARRRRQQARREPRVLARRLRRALDDHVRDPARAQCIREHVGLGAPGAARDAARRDDASAAAAAYSAAAASTRSASTGVSVSPGPSGDPSTTIASPRGSNAGRHDERPFGATPPASTAWRSVRAGPPPRTHDHGDRGHVVGERGRVDLVEGVGLGVVDVEVRPAVDDRARPARHAGRRHRPDVGAAVTRPPRCVRARAATAASPDPAIQRHQLLRRDPATCPSDRFGSGRPIERLRGLKPPLSVSSANTVLASSLAWSAAYAFAPCVPFSSFVNSTTRIVRFGASPSFFSVAAACITITSPAPSSCAPCPTSHESMCAPITTTSSGCTLPVCSPITFQRLGAVREPLRVELDMDGDSIRSRQPRDQRRVLHRHRRRRDLRHRVVVLHGARVRQPQRVRRHRSHEHAHRAELRRADRALRAVLLDRLRRTPSPCRRSTPASARRTARSAPLPPRPFFARRAPPSSSPRRPARSARPSASAPV